MMGKESVFDHRLMMIGLDSLNRPFVERNSNRLPNLARVLADPTTRALRSPADIASASVWPTLVSGKGPGHHGNYFPFQFDPSVMHYRNMMDDAWQGALDFEPFWFPLADLHVKPIVLDPGYISCTEHMPGIHVINWSFQSSGKAYSSPPEVLPEIYRRFGKRPIGAEVPVLKNAKQSGEIRDNNILSVRNKADAVLWLSQEYDWDFFLVGMFEVHRAGHNLWPVEREFASHAGAEDMLKVYEETDRQVGRILDSLDLKSTRVIFFSLNGMQINAAQDHFLSEILRRLNSVYLNNGTAYSDTVTQPNLMSYLRASVPPGLQYGLADILGEKVKDWVINRALVSNVDWTQTPSFQVHSGGEGLVRYNVKGRERDGYFDPGDPEFDNYKIWLKQQLLNIKVDESEEPLISEVIEVPSLFPGERSDLLPDLFVRWAPEESVSRVRSEEIGVIEHSLATGRGGNHNGESFATFFGGPFVDDELDKVSDIVDLSTYVRNWFEKQSVQSG